MTTPAPAEPNATALVPVRLLGLSLSALQEASEHTDELRREFAIMRLNDRQGVPDRLLSLMAELDDRYGSFSAGMNADVEAAQGRGADTVDVFFEIPDHAAEASRALLDLLDLADDYCRQGDNLLTLAPPTRVVEFRRWYLGEIIRQVAGERPTPWTDSAHGTEPLDEGKLLAELATSGHEIVLTLRGDVDLAVTDELRGQFLAIHDRAEGTVVVDLAGVDFMDSTGLSVLISAWKRLDGDKRLMILQNPTPAIVRLLNTCGLTDIFKVRKT